MWRRNNEIDVDDTTRRGIINRLTTVRVPERANNAPICPKTRNSGPSEFGSAAGQSHADDPTIGVFPPIDPNRPRFVYNSLAIERRFAPPLFTKRKTSVFDRRANCP